MALVGSPAAGLQGPAAFPQRHGDGGEAGCGEGSGKNGAGSQAPPHDGGSTAGPVVPDAAVDLWGYPGSDAEAECSAGITNVPHVVSHPVAGPLAQRHRRCVGAEVGRHNGSTTTQLGITSTLHQETTNKK